MTQPPEDPQQPEEPDDAAWMFPEDPWYAVNEPVDPKGAHVPREPVEKERRGVLIGLGIAFVALFLLNLAIPAFASDAYFERVGPFLNSAFQLVSMGVAAAFGYYFGKK